MIPVESLIALVRSYNPRSDGGLIAAAYEYGMRMHEGQFRTSGDFAGEVAIEESLWVDGNGRPQPIEQLVIQGMTSRSGGSFSWLLKQMG